MFPIVLKQGTAMATFGCCSNPTSLGSTPVCKITGILSSPPSDRYDIAQQTSIKISSISFSFRTLARDGIALYILWKSGVGLPLQKFESVQLAFLTKLLPGYALSKIFAIGLIAPAYITISLTFGLSPAIFPRPHIAYSMTSIWLEFNNSTNTLTVPFSNNTWTWSEFPLAKLVKHQAASN